MSEAHHPAAAAPALLDAPLPPAITGRQQGWLTRYRAYPVYSRPWLRLRWRLWGPGWAAHMLLLGGAMLSLPPGERPWGLLLLPALQSLLPIAAVPWLAGWVRRQGWPAAREWQALVALMVGCALGLALVVHLQLTEPLKNQVSAWTGHVDAQGQRKPLTMTVGVSVQTRDGAPGAAPAVASAPAATSAPAAAPQAVAPAASAPPVAPADPSDPQAGSGHRLVNALVWFPLFFWLGGGAGLWAWRREQAGLAALAQEQALAQAQAARREAEMQLSVLAAQVEPHFLFNTLAGVRSAIVSDPGRAALLVDRLVEYLRASVPRLSASGAPQATLGEQLQIVRAYLALMATRMPRLQFEVQAPQELLALPFPPWMLISLAENAVKHGVEPKIGPALVRVSARRSDDGRIEVVVEDDGVGFGGSTSGTGLGLANLRARLAQMYGARGSLQLQARPGGGVAATILLPAD